jgi:hypothetical protein
MKAISPVERMKVVDEALNLCKLAGRTQDEGLRVKRQAKAILVLAKIQRADMSVFREHLGMGNMEFGQAIFVARRLIRAGILFQSPDVNEALRWEIFNQFVDTKGIPPESPLSQGGQSEVGK